MLSAQAVELMSKALWLVLILSAPPIAMASLVGLAIAIFQSATQLQEQTLQYAGKFLVIVLTLFLTAVLFGDTLVAFGNQIFDGFPALVRR